MILTDCEVCGLKSVGGGHYIMSYANISKWRPKIKMADLLLLLRRIQGICAYVHFGVDGKLYVEVIRM